MKPNPTPKPSPRQLAERIVEELFKSRRGVRGDTLTVEKETVPLCYRDKSAVIDRIVKVLEAEGR